MCAIIDANVLTQAFGDAQNDAGKAFRQTVDDGRLVLVVGGKLLEELDKLSSFRTWRETAVKYGKAHLFRADEISSLSEELRQSNTCVSDDEHVIALAIVSGARLLFSNDKDLQKDFKNNDILRGGSVYSTLRSTKFTPGRRRSLTNAVCPANL